MTGTLIAEKTKAKAMHILIADDHPVYRSGVRSLLEQEADVRQVHEAADGREAIALCNELRPDVVVLDVSLPQVDGLEVLRRIRASAPEVRVVILSVSDDANTVARALGDGASAYVFKSASPEELLAGIRAAYDGRSYLSPAIQRLIAKANDGSIRAVYETLTPRERQVCDLLVAGNTVPDIAGQIGISRKTVDVHKTRLMRKLDVHNRANLVRFAMANGLGDNS